MQVHHIRTMHTVFHMNNIHTIHFPCYITLCNIALIPFYKVKHILFCKKPDCGPFKESNSILFPTLKKFYYFTCTKDVFTYCIHNTLHCWLINIGPRIHSHPPSPSFKYPVPDSTRHPSTPPLHGAFPRWLHTYQPRSYHHRATFSVSPPDSFEPCYPYTQPELSPV